MANDDEMGIVPIEETGLLPKEMIDSLKENMGDITQGFLRRQRFRPRFLMETSVLNDMNFPTPDGKFWQCTVERDVHFRNLVMLSFDYREKQADIGILEAEIERLKGGTHQTSSYPSIDRANIKKKQVQVERHKQQLVYMAKEARERVREVLNWTDIMKKLRPQLEYDPEDIEAWMPKGFAMQYQNRRNLMEITGRLNIKDMDGGMNTIALHDSMINHPSVQKLIAKEKEKKLLEKN